MSLMLMRVAGGITINQLLQMRHRLKLRAKALQMHCTENMRSSARTVHSFNKLT